MENIKNYADGRMNRKNYIKYNIILLVAALLAMIPLYIVAGEHIAVAAVSLLLIPVSFCLDAKRLHDIGQSTNIAVGLAALSFVSILIMDGPVSDILAAVSTIAFVYLCIAKGDEGSNAYGMA